MANTKVLKRVRKMNFRTLLRPLIKIGRTPTFRAVLLHALIMLAMIALPIYFINSREWVFLVITLSLFFIGMLHTWLLYVVHDWSDREEGNGIWEASLTVGINFLGMLSFFFLFGKGLINYTYIAILASTTFSLPFFWDRAMQFYRSIPEKVFPPLIIRTLEDIKGKIVVRPNLKGIVWVFEDKNSDLPSENERMFMPYQAGDKRGELSIENIFKSFILYYNSEKNQSNPIQLFRTLSPEAMESNISEHNSFENHYEGIQYFKWYLYHRPLNILPKRILNPKLTVRNNRMAYQELTIYDENDQKLKVKVVKIFVKLVQASQKQHNQHEIISAK